MDDTQDLRNSFHTLLGDSMQAMATSEFYLELSLIAVAILVGALSALLIRRIALRKLDHPSPTQSPQQTFIRSIARKILYFTTPAMVLLGLNLALPLAEKVLKTKELTVAFIALTIAWLIGRVVRTLVANKHIGWFITAVIFCYTALTVTGFTHSTAEFLNGMSLELGKYTITMLGVIKGLIILVIVFWAAGSLSALLENALRRASSLSYNARELIVKFFRVFVYAIALLLTLGAVGVDLTALAVFGGALGVGIGLGLQKITANFVSGVILLFEKSIKLGDLIEVDNQTGHVKQLYMRYALVETADGRELLIPNEQLMSSRVTNWTYSNEAARIDIRLTLPYDSDIERAQKLMLDAAKAHPRFKKNPPPNCWVREFAANGILLQLTFWIPDVHEGRNTPQSEVMLVIMNAFREAGIRFATPPQEVKIVGAA